MVFKITTQTQTAARNRVTGRVASSQPQKLVRLACKTKHRYDWVMELAAQQGGYIARKTGNELEVFIHDRLKREGYVFVPPNKFEASKLLEQPTYTRQFKVGKGVYDTSVRCDFILYHPE